MIDRLFRNRKHNKYIHVQSKIAGQYCFLILDRLRGQNTYVAKFRAAYIKISFRETITVLKM